MYAAKLLLCLVLLNLHFCAGDDKTNASPSRNSRNNTSPKKPSQNNLGPQFADEYENNGKEVAQGTGEAFGLSPEQTQVLQEILVFLGRFIAYIVGAQAQGDSHVNVDPNSSQADKNGKIAAVIGQGIGDELVSAPLLNSLLNDKEKKTISSSNSLLATLIARFFGTLGDFATAIGKKSLGAAFKALLKYFNVNNDG